MTNALELNVAIDIDTLAFSISNLSYDNIIKLFKAVDEMVAEYDFTQSLVKTFQSGIDDENKL